MTVDQFMSTNVIPDSPQSFGYKMAWFAIPAEDSARVISVFRFKNARPANWVAGVQTVYSDLRHAFVTPPVDGWTLVLGLGLPSFDTEERTREFLAFIDTVAASFPDFYYFGTHRVVDFHSWVRVSDRKIQRAYAYLGERGETLYESGSKTEEEIALGFDFFDERSHEAASEAYFEREDLRYPNEEDVMRISAAWTINTQTLDQRTEKGTGFLAEIK
jgi:hypothetical protein